MQNEQQVAAKDAVRESDFKYIWENSEKLILTGCRQRRHSNVIGFLPLSKASDTKKKACGKVDHDN